MKIYHLGVLGVAGHFIGAVLPPLLQSKTVQVYGIASRDGEKAAEAARQYGIPKSYASYQALLEDPAIDLVYIPLPNHLHAEWIKKCADYGKHVICEKPLTMNAAEAREALDYARAKGVRVMEAFMYRFHPQWRRALEIVKFHGIGALTGIHTFFGYSNKDPHNIRNIKETGGGAIYDIGCYAVSTARFLMQGEPQRVLGLANYDPCFQTDILVNGVLDFGGIRTLFTVATQTFPFQKVEVYGTNGVMTVEIPFNMYPDCPAQLTVRNGVGSRTVQLGPADQYQLEFEEFVAAIAAGRETPIAPEDAVCNMKVLDALYRSARTGEWENV